MRSFLWVLLVTIGMLSSAAVARPAADLGWTVYKNPRFGLQMRYPAEVFTLHRTSQARDGDLFATADGSAKLLIGAFENSERHSPASYQRYIARESYPGMHADYAPVGAGWSVLSGTRGETMIYEKVMFSCSGRVINSFALVYPIAERYLYDPIVEAIEDSFQPGSVGCDEHAARF
jgi:hypothetical protein